MFSIIGSTPALPNKTSINCNYNGNTFPCGTIENPEGGRQAIKWNVEAIVFNEHKGAFEEKREVALRSSAEVIAKFEDFLSKM